MVSLKLVLRFVVGKDFLCYFNFMFDPSLIISWIVKYRYLVLLPTIFEGPIITVIAGYLSFLGFLNFYIAYAIIVLGDTIGDILCYATGRWGRWKFFKKWGELLDLEKSKVAKMEKYFGRHAGKTLFVGKFGYGIVASLLFASGVANVSFSRFLAFTFPATLIKSMMLLLIGFYFGYAYKRIALYLDYTSYIMIVAAILLVAIYFYFQRRAKKILENNKNNL
jgi:membrane protein DedA with SNARE-associated domain